MDVRPVLRRRWPILYKWLVLLRNQQRALSGLPHRLHAEWTLRRVGTVCVEIDQNVGIGGLLSNAAKALAAGHRTSTQVYLKFTSATYMPSWAPDDWLDSYFVRLDGACECGPTIRARHISQRFAPSLSESGRLIWAALDLRPELKEAAARHIHGAYAAVHFRGSDKYLEAPRLAAARILERVELEMQQRGLTRLFVASDETSFVDLAIRHFGVETAYSLPLEAVAIDGVPPHFANISGEVKAAEALVTMQILAGARVCVRTESYLSAWAETIASPDADFILVGSET